MKWTFGTFVVDSNPSRIDMERVYANLRTTYWGVERSFGEVESTWGRSNPVFGVYVQHLGGIQAGCARVLTDGLTFGWLADVVIAPEYRGQGLGKFLVRCVLEHPDCANLKQFLLATRDAHRLYTPFGWKPAPVPQNYLIRFDPKSLTPSQIVS